MLPGPCDNAARARVTGSGTGASSATSQHAERGAEGTGMSMSAGTGARLGARLLAVATVLALLGALAPARPAFACSCAPLTFDEIVARGDGAAVARIRRVDAGTRPGTGEVLEVLHGPELPTQVSLDLDDGGSCQPWVAVGSVAVLAFEPRAGDWRTMVCGQLEPTLGMPDVGPDPAAGDDLAAVVWGRFPGAEVVALDTQLRVRSHTLVGAWIHDLVPCGDGLLAVLAEDDGRSVLTRLDLPTLAVGQRHVITEDPEAFGELQDVACQADGRVDVLTTVWGEVPQTVLQRDVFGDLATTMVPGTQAAAFAGEEVVFLETPAVLGEGPIVVATLDPSTGQRTRLLQHRGEGHTIDVSPDGARALVSGYDGGSLLLAIDLAAGEVDGVVHGEWRPVTHPWLAGNDVLQRNDDTGGMDGPGLVRHRVTGPRLDGGVDLPPAPGSVLGAGGDEIIRASSDGLTVLDAEGGLVRTLAAPWAAGASGVALFGDVAPDPDAAPLLDLTAFGIDTGAIGVAAEPAAAGSPTTDAIDPAPPSRTLWAGLAVLGLVVVAGAAALALRRRRLS